MGGRPVVVLVLLLSTVTHFGDMGTLPQPHPTMVTLCLLPQVRDWTQDESSNRGLLVTVHSLGGSTLEAPAVQFASSGDHHESKKPMLVLFTDDGRRGASLPMAGVPGGCHTAGGRAQVPACRLQLCLSLNAAVLRAVATLMTTVGLQSCHLLVALHSLQRGGQHRRSAFSLLSGSCNH